MRIYQAVANSFGWDAVEEITPHMLISYHFLRTLGPADRLLSSIALFPGDVIIDSGAFSAWTKGATIPLADYVAFGKALKEVAQARCLEFINLDVIPGRFGDKPTKKEVEYSAQKGWENMAEIEAAGLPCLPVYHQGEGFAWLQRMVEERPRFCISPQNGLGTNSHLAFYEECIGRHVEAFRSGRIRVHGLAVTGLREMLALPWFSVDSASTSICAGYGIIITWTGNPEGFAYNRLSEEPDLPVDPALRGRGTGPSLARLRRNVGEMLKAEKDLTRIWALRGVSWDE